MENENKGYIVGYGEIFDDYDFHLVNVVLDSLDSIVKVTEEHIMNFLRRIRENETSGVYMPFGGVLKEMEDDGCVARFFITEMRSGKQIIEFKIYEIDL